MKVFVAGATGAIGRRLLPWLVGAGHKVVAMTRHSEAMSMLAAMGAEPVIADVYDAETVRAVLRHAAPDAVMHQLTDLSQRDYAANARLRIEGTPNLVAAAREIGVARMVAQSIAWLYRRGDTPAVESDPLDERASAYPGITGLEACVHSMPEHVVLRYGTLYGPGTWYAPDGAITQEARLGQFVPGTAWTSFLHVDDAAAAAVAALEWPSGVYNVVDDEPATPAQWAPVFCEALGVDAPSTGLTAEASGRPVSNAAASSLGWRPGTPSWRSGFLTTLTGPL